MQWTLKRTFKYFNANFAVSFQVKQECTFSGAA